MADVFVHFKICLVLKTELLNYTFLLSNLSTMIMHNRIHYLCAGVYFSALFPFEF